MTFVVAESHRIHSVSLSTGVTLPHVEQGDPAGVPVLLLHGYADSWRFFEPLLGHLPESVRAFAVTQRGHGDADRPTDGYRQEDFVADVAAFMDAVGLEAAVIAGQSSGGYTAQRFAVDRPERVLGLVLLGSPKDFYGKPGAWDFLRPLADLTDPVDPQFVRDLMDNTITESLPPAFLDTLIAESSKLPAHVWRATFQGLLDAEVPTERGTITAPTLILWGDGDELAPRRDQEGLRTAIAGAELVTYEGTGHSVACEQPARAAADIAAFAQRLQDMT